MKPQSQYDTLVLIRATEAGLSPTEDSFLAPELPLLNERFGRVLTLTLDTPVGRLERLRASMSKVAIRAVWEALTKGGNLLDANAYGAHTALWVRRLERMMASGNIDPDRTIFYTFWFDTPTVALGLMQRRRRLTVVSRAHGYDIRERKSGWLRCIGAMGLCALLPASDFGNEALRLEFPGAAHVISTAPLGTPAPLSGGPEPASEGPVTVVSCSRISEVKRVPLVARLVAMLSRAMPGRQVRWVHVGGGDDRIRRQAESEIDGTGAYVEWVGSLPNDKVHQLYRTIPVHWLVITSRDEGGRPLAVTEAMSYGIPVVGTAVGGIPEMVVDGVNGLLMDALADDASLGMAVSRMAAYMEDHATYTSLREAACRTWEERGDAAMYRRRFIELLDKL